VGQTAPRAEAPPAPQVAAIENAVASRIPSAGVAYGMPVRRGESKPVYPALLKSQGLEANVTVLLQLDASGAVTKVQIVKPAQYPEFNEAARRAALAERFEPATRDGVAIPYSLSFTYRFRLEDP
jgi:protein TonB